MSDTDRERIEALEARVDKATAGPWRVQAELTLPIGCPSEIEHRASGRQILREGGGEVTFAWDYVEDIIGPDDVHVFCGGHDYNDSGYIGLEDAEFIAHAREDVPFLLSQIAALTEALRVAQEVAERYRWLRRSLESAVGGGVEVNDARLVYQKPEPGEAVCVYWYPDTPVGFYESKADTLDAAIDAALSSTPKEPQQ